MLCVAYETRARREELVALKVRDIEFWPNGTGQGAYPPAVRPMRRGRGGWPISRARR
jgi:integrase